MHDEDDDDRKDKISGFLGMRSIDEVISKKDEILSYGSNLPVVQEAPQVDPRKDEDFETARDMMKSILEVGTDALEEMSTIAAQSQSPIVYEKLGALMNSLTAASKTLLDIHKRKKEIDKVELDNPGLKDGADAAPTTHNHLYVGSTADLQRLIQDMRKPEDGSDQN